MRFRTVVEKMNSRSLFQVREWYEEWTGQKPMAKLIARDSEDADIQIEGELQRLDERTRNLIRSKLSAMRFRHHHRADNRYTYVARHWTSADCFAW